MSINQGESINNSGADGLLDGKTNNPGEKYKVIIVSRNDHIHEAVVKTLQHFSLNGKGIHIFCSTSLNEAQIVFEQNPEVILVVIDNNIQVNGSYLAFENYIRQEIGNTKCCITFKESLINSNNCNDLIDCNNLKNEDDSFYYARERLIDIARMVMLTTEMEEKINIRRNVEKNINKSPIEQFEDTTQYTKDKLYTVLAHDLKEPVGNIKVMLDFLTNEPGLLDQQTSKDLLQRVRESADNIHDMLEDFMFWSRMFKQDVYFNPRKVDVEDVVRENIVLLKSTAAAKDIDLSMEIPPETFAFADEYMITTVIRNILYNAIKFTGTGGSIHINASSEVGFIEIHIEDNGIGIPEEDLEKLFKVDVYFSTAGTEEESGAGLGLILCKDFIERNGGKIFVKSTKTVGSTFSFTLPSWGYK